MADSAIPVSHKVRKMLTEVQKLDCHSLLGVPAGEWHTNDHRQVSKDLYATLAGLSDAQETRVTEILDQFQKIRNKTGRLKGEYEDDPAQTRALLKQNLMDVIGFSLARYDLGNRFTIGRA